MNTLANRNDLTLKIMFDTVGENSNDAAFDVYEMYPYEEVLTSYFKIYLYTMFVSMSVSSSCGSRKQSFKYIPEPYLVLGEVSRISFLSLFFIQVLKPKALQRFRIVLKQGILVCKCYIATNQFSLFRRILFYISKVVNYPSCSVYVTIKNQNHHYKNMAGSHFRKYRVKTLSVVKRILVKILYEHKI